MWTEIFLYVLDEGCSGQNGFRARKTKGIDPR